MAKREALAAGYQEAVMLDAQGYVTEASGENLFAVHDGVIVTAPLGSSILGGITRDSVIALASASGYRVVERPMTRDELYIADEIFLCGTAAEVTPVRELDDRKIGAGKRGPVTAAVQSAYFECVRGKLPSRADWITRV